MRKQTTRRRTFVIIAAFAAVYLIWGSTFLAIKFGLRSFPPYLMAGFRFLVAGLILWGVARFRGSKKATSKQWIHAAILGGLFFMGANGTVTWAQQYLPSGLAALLVSTEPLWIVLLSRLLHVEKEIRWNTMLGTAAGFGGLILLFDVNGGGFRSEQLLPALAVIGAGGCWAAGSLLSLRFDKPDEPLQGNGMVMLCGGLWLLCTALFRGEPWQLNPTQVSTLSIVSVLYLILFGSVVAFTAYRYMIEHVTPSKVATYAYVNPMVAVFLGWMLAGEQLTAVQLLATGLILIGVILISRKTPREPSEESPKPVDPVLAERQRAHSRLDR